jgi:photosystem II stability/assembly factor-like uncharacterized protein
VVSSHEPTRLYHASQRVWRSEDRGDTWTPISGDLTRDQDRMQLPIMGRRWSWDAGWDIYAMSVYNTISALAESPVDENVIYAGTDDGLIQITTDGGETWTETEAGSLRGVPDLAYVNDFEPSRFEGGHRLHGAGQSQIRRFRALPSALGQLWPQLADDHQWPARE